MSAGGFDNNLRRGLAIVMALLTLAVAALWVDSYRWHAPDRTVVATKGIPAFGEPRNLPPAEAHDDIGLSRSLNVGDGRQITFFSIQGGLGFQQGQRA